jgi:hypothetical protein
MGYISIFINKNNNNRKYILFYAEYLQEAWLSEVLENDTTRILKQFRCKNVGDVEKVASYLSKSGNILNLAANDTSDKRLMKLEHKLNVARNTRSLFSILKGFKYYTFLLHTFSRPAVQ